jgi:hypothetical protein
MRELSLVRMIQPGGAVVDQVSPAVYPSGPPSWYPGTIARVLYAGTDGRPFRLDIRKPKRR